MRCGFPAGVGGEFQGFENNSANIRSHTKLWFPTHDAAKDRWKLKLYSLTSSTMRKLCLRSHHEAK